MDPITGGSATLLLVGGAGDLDGATHFTGGSAALLAFGGVGEVIGEPIPCGPASLSITGGEGLVEEFIRGGPAQIHITGGQGRIAGPVYPGPASITINGGPGAVVPHTIDISAFDSAPTPTLPLSAAIPLRTTAVWGSFQNIQTIPHGYGRVTSSPVPYNSSRTEFVWLDHSAGGIDSVSIDGRQVQGWEAGDGLDKTGHAVHFIRFTSPVPEQSAISVTGRGKRDPDTGELITNPMDMAYDVVTRLAGHTLSRDDVWPFRSELARQSFEIAVLVDDNTRTMQSLIDRVLGSVGAVWGRGFHGFGRLYPDTIDADEQVWAEIDAANWTVQLETNAGDIYTALRVRFDYDWAKGDHRQVLELVAPDQVLKYGYRVTELDSGAIASPRLALAVGSRKLSHWSRPRWPIRAEGDNRGARLRPGMVVDVQHFYVPPSLRGHQLIASVERSRSNGATILGIEAVAGPAPRIVQTRLSVAFDPSIIGVGGFGQVGDNFVYRVADENDLPIVGALVELDGELIRFTNAAGLVYFDKDLVEPGIHQLRIVAEGFEPQIVEVQV